MAVWAAVVRVLQGGNHSVRWPPSRDGDHRTVSPFGGRQFHCGCISFSIVHQFPALIEYLLQTLFVHIISYLRSLYSPFVHRISVPAQEPRTAFPLLLSASFHISQTVVIRGLGISVCIIRL